MVPLLKSSSNSDLFTKIFNLSRLVKSHKIRVRVLKEQLEKSKEIKTSNGVSEDPSFATYLEEEIAKSSVEYKRTQKRLVKCKRQCRELVGKNDEMRILFERLSEHILVGK